MHSFQLTKKTTVVFADRLTGKTILSTADGFTGAMGAFDRSARMKRSGPIDDIELLTFAGNAALDWDEKSLMLVTSALEAFKDGISGYAGLIPDTVYIIKTTGDEEFKSAYTRQNAIIMPLNKLDYAVEKMARLLAHEFFHIISRYHPELREKLYEAIGFKSCGKIEVPADIRDRTLANLDTPGEDYYIRLEYQGETVSVIPLFFMKDDRCDIRHGEDILQYIVMRYLAIENDGNKWHYAKKNGSPFIIDPEKVTGLYEQIGHNTDYVICPEEVLAENFMMDVIGEKGLPTPELPEKMKTVMKDDIRSNRYE